MRIASETALVERDRACVPTHHRGPSLLHALEEVLRVRLEAIRQRREDAMVLGPVGASLLGFLRPIVRRAQLMELRNDLAPGYSAAFVDVINDRLPGFALIDCLGDVRANLA